MTDQDRRQRSEQIKKRFWAKVKKTDGGCWLWKGSLNTRSYGQLWWNGRLGLVHRLSYFLHKGEIPDGKEVCHKCDVPNCVNPSHLFLASHSENMLDGYNKGRVTLPNHGSKQACKYGHAYTPNNTIRKADGTKRCRTCQRGAWRRYEAKDRARAKACREETL